MEHHDGGAWLNAQKLTSEALQFSAIPLQHSSGTHWGRSAEIAVERHTVVVSRRFKLLSYAVTTLLVCLGLVLAWASIYVVNRLWPMEKRKPCNEVIGWQLTVLGTTYAVILGFMMYNVWTEFRTTSVDVSNEATAVLEVFRLAATLPEAATVQAQGLAHRYAQQVIQTDWPNMASYRSPQLPSDGVTSIAALWDVVQAARMQSPANAGYDQFTDALTRLEKERNTREEQYRSHMPFGLWILLLAGGVLVIGSSCFLGHDKGWLHYTQVLSLTFTILVTLAAIADIDHPFAGSVSVSPIAFRDALETMEMRKSNLSIELLKPVSQAAVRRAD